MRSARPSIAPRLNESHFAAGCYGDWISFLHPVFILSWRFACPGVYFSGRLALSNCLIRSYYIHLLLFFIDFSNF